jgi:hypothetical protein
MINVISLLQQYLDPVVVCIGNYDIILSIDCNARWFGEL